MKASEKFLFAIAIFITGLTAAQTDTLILHPSAARGQDWDAAVASGTPNGTSATDPDFMSMIWTCGGPDCVIRSMINFDLSSIPSGATITSATLYLYADINPSDGYYGAPAGSNNAGWIQRVTSSWTVSNVTWNTQPTTTTLNEVAVPQSTSNNENYTLRIDTIIRDIISSGSNYGIELRQQQESTPYNILFFGSSNNSDSTLHPMLKVVYSYLKASITSSVTNVCAGDTVQFYGGSTVKSNTWNWKFSGGQPASSGIQNPKVYYKNPGKNNVQLIIDDSGLVDSVTYVDYINVIASPVPQVTINGNKSTFCENTGSLQSDFSSKNQWYYNGSPVAGDTSQHLFPGSSGFYAVMVTDSFGCTGMSSPTSVTVLPAPVAQIGSLNNSAICAGTPDTLYAFGAGKYLWSTTDTSSSIIITPAETTPYSLTVTGSNGCSSTAMDTVIVKPAPATPVIQQNGNLFASSLPSGNQWYLDGSPINGATNQYYTPRQSGFYSVIITGSNGCTSVSNSINYLLSGINPFSQSAFHISIYPNPSNGLLTIGFDTEISENLSLHIYNTLGELVYSGIIAKGNKTIQLDVSGTLKNGVYSLLFEGASGTNAQKIMIAAN